MDPWQPLNSESCDCATAKTSPVTLTTILPQIDERKTMDSAQYLSVIEARLERIKGTGCSKSQAPKDIIEGLDQIRTAQLHAASTGPDSSMPYLRNCDYITDLSSSSTIIDTVRRKIAPEKQALNEEELRSLIENDELRDKTVLLYSDQPPADVTSPESFDTLNT